MKSIDELLKTSNLHQHHAKVEDKDKMNHEQIESFKESYKTVLLTKGYILHRITGKNNPIGSCWIDDETFRGFMNDLTQLEISVPKKQNNLRNDMGLLSEWKNTLSRRIKMTLKKDTVAHLGIIGPQSTYIDVNSTKFGPNELSEGRAVQQRIEWRRGGHYQYVIPSIAKASIDKAEEYGFEINIFQNMFNTRNVHRK